MIKLKRLITVFCVALLTVAALFAGARATGIEYFGCYPNTGIAPPQRAYAVIDPTRESTVSSGWITVTTEVSPYGLLTIVHGRAGNPAAFLYLLEGHHTVTSTQAANQVRWQAVAYVGLSLQSLPPPVIQGYNQFVNWSVQTEITDGYYTVLLFIEGFPFPINPYTRQHDSFVSDIVFYNDMSFAPVLLDGERVYRLPFAGTDMLFTSRGVITMNGRYPLFFNGRTRTFEDDFGRRAELVWTTLQGAAVYQLETGRYSVRSIEQTDNLFVLGLRPNTRLNPSAEVRDILLVRTRRRGFWNDVNSNILGNVRFDYADIRGVLIPEEYLIQARRIPSLMAFSAIAGGTIVAGPVGFVLAIVAVNVANRALYAAQVPRWGTIADLAEEVRFLIDHGFEFGDKALHPETGLPLVDNRGQIVYISSLERNRGQLKDAMHYYLVCLEHARPLWFENGRFVNHFGAPLTFEGQTIVGARSSFPEGERLYPGLMINSLNDNGEITGRRAILPGTAVREANGNFRWYDLNGVEVIPPELIRPTGHPITDNDYFDRNPEAMPTPDWIPSWLERTLGWLRELIGFDNSTFGWAVTIAAAVGLIILAAIAVAVISIIVGAVKKQL